MAELIITGGNPVIYGTDSPEFSRFGRRLDFDTSEAVRAFGQLVVPQTGSRYSCSEPIFESIPTLQKNISAVFGELAVQTGLCCGHNDSLNAFEWHKCPEVNIALTDLILILGDIRDVDENQRISSDKSVIFRLEAGEAVEIYPATLHFCPIECTSSGFGCVVGLPRGTNEPLDAPSADRLLFRKNKWLLAHTDNSALIGRGAVAGIYGENIKIKAAE